MENITEKKWFVYVQDHHEGPHSLLEIQEKLDQGLVESEGFVWSEGMDDWQKMTDVAMLKSLIKTKSGAHISDLKTQIKDSLTNDQSERNQRLTGETTHLDHLMESDLAGAEDLDVPLLRQNQNSVDRKKGSKTSKLLVGRGLVVGGLFLLGVGYRMGYLQPIIEPITEFLELRSVSDSLASWSRPILLKTTQDFPVLARWVSPIPQLDDVSPADFVDLQDAARADFKRDGARYSIAVSQGNSGSPYFYMTSNIEEGAKFKIWIVGVSETLLNQLYFVSQFDVSISHGIAKTEVIRSAEGGVIPRGEYRIYLTSAEDQPDGKTSLIESTKDLSGVRPPELPKNATILLVKNYFLGGALDASYRERLKDFHEKLRARASGEVIETRQFMLALSSQLITTQEKFSKIKKSKLTSKDKKLWAAFHHEWTQSQAELDQIFQKWSPAVIKNDYFYGDIYQLVQDLSHSVSGVHDLQQLYFTENQDMDELQSQIEMGFASANQALEVLRAKIDHTEKLSPSPSGMPQRDGL